MKGQKCMKRNKTIAFLALLSLGIYTGCSKQEQEAEKTEAIIENVQEKEEEAEEIEEILQQESVLYQKYQRALLEIDKNWKACPIVEEDGWESAQDCYREFLVEEIWGMYEHNKYSIKGEPMNEMKGILAAEEVRDDLGRKIGFGLRIAVSEADEIWEYRYYEYSYSDMKYITCRNIGEKEGDMPEYQLCEEILAHENVSGSDYGEAKWAAWMDEYGDKTDGEVKEYCVVDNHVYQIDREKKQFYDVTGQIEYYMAEWLQREKERVHYSMQRTFEAVEKVKELIPDGYRLKDETDIAVCDLNHDREDDYVVSIYDPVTMTEDEYYNAVEDMWLFLSERNGEYTKKQLVEDGLYCTDLRFVADGILLCENLYAADYYRRPVRKDYFFYDDVTENFYIDKVHQGIMLGGVLLEDKTTLGNLTVDEYYYNGTRESISSGTSGPFYNVDVGDGEKISFFSEVTYRNVNKEMEKTINDKVFGMEFAVAEKFVREFHTDIIINSYLNYLNTHIFVGCIEASIFKTRDEDTVYKVPVMIDLESGEFLDITDLISKEDFIKICQKGMKDRYRNELSAEDRERGINLIEKEYENAARITSSGEMILLTGDVWICFEITSWGVWITGKDAVGEIEFMLDKEYFIDTPLWHYMEPDLEKIK